MSSKIKNIIVFSGIAVALIFVYVYFIKGDEEEGSFVSSTPNETSQGVVTSPQGSSSAVTQDFITLLSNTKSIKLDDAIFSDKAFLSLRDSTIILTPDGNEGRPNPFAPIGSDVLIEPTE